VIGQLGRVSVRRRRSGVDDATHLRLLRRQQDVQGTGDIGLMRCDRIPRRPGHRRDGGLVEDVIHALHCPPARLEPGHVAAHEADAIADVAKMFAAASRQIVEHGDIRAIAHEALDDVGADESGTASDEESHATR